MSGICNGCRENNICIPEFEAIKKEAKKNLLTTDYDFKITTSNTHYFLCGRLI